MFLEFPWFSYDPTDVGNLIYGSSAFSKSSLYIWKFSVHILLKPSLKDFEYYLAGMWNKCNYAVVWTFFGNALLWDWNESDLLQSCGHCWAFQSCWYTECSSTFTASSFRTWNSSAGIPSPPLALFVAMLQSPLGTPGCLAPVTDYTIEVIWVIKPFFVQFFCTFLPLLLNLFCFC